MATEKEKSVNVSDIFERYSYNPETGEITWNELPNMTHKKPTQHYGMKAFTTKERKGYMNGSVSGVHLKAHRVAWLLYYGVWPEDQIDHINGIPDDNRIVNLRSVSNLKNTHNRNMSRANTSGWTGVSYYKQNGMWRAKFKKRSRNYSVGYFNCPTVAHFAILKARTEFGFDKEHGARGRPSIGF